MRTSGTRVAARAGLLVGALVVAAVLAIVLAEALLQIGSAIVRANGRPESGGFQSERRRVVAFGDSNTYGLYLDPEEAYPAQLETLWNAVPDAPPIEVANLGYPGTNSSVVTREFAPALRSLAPDVVIVMIGVNDMWTEHVEVGAEAGAWDRAVDFVVSHSRVLRFVSILRGGRMPGSGTIEGRQIEGIPRELEGHVGADGTALTLGFEGTREGTLAVDGPRLLANLERLVRESRALGVELVLMTYPTDGRLYRFSNIVIRRAASRTGARLVDLTPVFDAHCPDPDCAELLFEDRHPKPAGYGLIAQTLVAEIGDLLGR
jgi:lysophospholipase L1-like esterase